MLNAVRIPDGVDDAAGRKRLLAEFGIEVGGGLGEFKGKAWRIGLMGYNSRPGVWADWRRVFREAASRRVAIELDGNWHRQDIDFELARVALDEGCLFALDSDAHSLGELPFTDYAIAHARIAGIPANRVVNCWDAKTFDRWLSERRR